MVENVVTCFLGDTVYTGIDEITKS